MTIEAIILAGGSGKRMRLPVRKPMLDLFGKPLLQHVLETAAGESDRRHVVHAPGMEADLEALAQASGQEFTCHVQPEPRGTADAFACALGALVDDAVAVALCADMPMLSAKTLATLLEATPQSGLVVLTMKSLLPSDTCGRLIRDEDDQVIAIREHADASDEEKMIMESNTGVLAARVADWKRWVAKLDTDNAQGELYLSDCVAQAVAEGAPVATCESILSEARGINTANDYADIASSWQHRARRRLRDQGVFMDDSGSVQLSAYTEVEEGAAVWIGPNVIFEGKVRLGEGVRIGACTVLRDCDIGADVRIEPFSVIERAIVGRRCRIGPFARIRPETVLAEEVRIGNFVEVKKSEIGAGSKVNHLSYVGDTQVGRDVNIGAGTITCNYDGAAKHQTVIGDDVFIGSGTQLVAPVTVEDGATIGAGSTITKDAPADALTLTRAEQKTVDGWRRLKKES